MAKIKTKQRSQNLPSRFTILPRLGVCILLSLFLVSCVTLQDPESSQEFQSEPIGLVTKDQSIGQSFHSRRPRLNSIQLWLRIKSDLSKLPQSSKLDITLYHSINDLEPILSKSIPLEAINQSFPITVSFTPQEDPPGQSYYINLKTNEEALEVYGRNEDAYPNGLAYLDGNPLDADFAFRLSYDYDLRALYNDLIMVLSKLWLVFPLILILWLPGRLIFLIYQISGERGNLNNFDWGESVAISIGLSLAFFSVLMLWTTTFGFRWNSSYTSILIAAIALIFGWILYKKHFSLVSELKSIKFSSQLLNFSLGVIFILALGVRLAMVRDMATPAWVDSVHHAVVTRSIVEQGQYPDSYLPYLETTTTSYHSGFHSNLAFFHWISGITIPDGMLLFGQILNAACIFSVYLFSKTIFKNRLAGIIAACASAFFTPMPAYYTSWGRYTQLVGILILPVVYALTLNLSQEYQKFTNLKSLIRNRSGFFYQLFIVAIALSGLMLIHYRVSAFFFCLIFAYWIVEVSTTVQEPWFKRVISPSLAIIIPIGILSVLLTFPWWPAAVSTLISPHIVQNQIAVKPFGDFSWQFLNSALGKYINALALLGITWGLLRRNRSTFVILIWILLLFILANLGVFSLPGTGLINNLSVEIMLFLPISALCGHFLVEILEGWDELLPPIPKILFRFAACILTVALLYLGMKSILPILNPITMLSRSADKRALKWVGENLPQNATFIINPFLWGYGIYAGNDGGYWITPVAGRRTVPPPVIFAMGESKSQIENTTEKTRHVINISNSPTELYNFMESENIDYIFIGARGGILSPKLLRSSSEFQEIYYQDGVWIFKRR